MLSRSSVAGLLVAGLLLSSRDEALAYLPLECMSDSDLEHPRSRSEDRVPLEQFIAKQASCDLPAAFKWLAEQQAEDGSWQFSIPDDPASRSGSRVEATAWVLIAMASIGQDHKSRGPFQDGIRKGVEFLLAQQRGSPRRNDFTGKDGSLVAHAVATSALADLYGMTHEARLRDPVRRAADLILARQDPKTGRWTTPAGKTADIEVTYRQLSALSAAGAALGQSKYRQAVIKADPVLGTFASRESTGCCNRNLTVAAMNVISRMDVAGKRDDKAWEPTIRRLVERGPARGNAECNFFATQAVFDWEGDESSAFWEQWSRELRGELGTTQIKEGEQAGSWPPSRGHSRTDDRLYRTALNAVALAIRTRHMQRYFQFH